MATFDALPGRLNFNVRQNDDVSATVDFSISLTAYTMVSTISSLVDGSTVGTFTTTLTDASAGKVNVALSDAQTSALAAGTYRWQMTGTQGSLTRTYLDGYVEVTR